MPLNPKQQPPYYTQSTLLNEFHILTTTKTLTNAQVLTLPTTHIEILPSPSSGKIIQPIYYMLQADTSGGQWDNITTDSYLYLETTSGFFSILARNKASESITQLFGLFQDQAPAWQFGACLNIILSPSSEALIPVNKSTDVLKESPLYLKANNTGNYTAGHTTNYLKLHLLYTIITL